MRGREGNEVRIHGVVQVKTVPPPGTIVPTGWVAVGDPAKIYPPGQHEQSWGIQVSVDFPETVYGVTPEFLETAVERRAGHAGGSAPGGAGAAQDGAGRGPGTGKEEARRAGRASRQRPGVLADSRREGRAGAGRVPGLRR